MKVTIIPEAQTVTLTGQELINGIMLDLEHGIFWKDDEGRYWFQSMEALPYLEGTPIDVEVDAEGLIPVEVIDQDYMDDLQRILDALAVIRQAYEKRWDDGVHHRTRPIDYQPPRLAKVGTESAPPAGKIIPFPKPEPDDDFFDKN